MRLAVVVALTAGVALGGCGNGSDSSSTSTQASLSKAGFISQANAICRRANQQLQQTAKKEFGGGPPSAAQAEAFLEKHVIPAIEAETKDIRELPPPSGDEQQVSQLLDAVEQGAQKAKSDPNSLQAHGPADPMFRGSQLAQRYGLTVCAQQ